MSDGNKNHFDILCVGLANADVLVRPADGICFDVDTIVVDDIRLTNGGDAMNVAINMSRLSNRVAFAGMVGKDNYGEFLMKTMMDLGINTESLHESKAAYTACAICLVRSDGERCFLYCPGAHQHFCYDDINQSILERSRIVFVGGTYAMPMFDGEGTARLFKNAKRYGKITAMDVCWNFSGDWGKIGACLPYLDYFLPSINEAREITGKTEVEAMADDLLARGVGNVIIKMGRDGVFLKNSVNRHSCKPLQVAVMDTTGAGDSFNSGFLTGVLHGYTLLQSVQFGIATSAFCIQQLGACAPDISFQKIHDIVFRG